jgi:integrase
LLPLDGKALRNLFIDYIASEQRRGSAGSYIAYTLKVVRSWLRFNDREVPARLKVRDSDRVREETALSQPQLNAILDHASAREKVAISLMAMSGVRPEVLGNFLGDDGLKISDFPELEIHDRKVAFQKTPTSIVVRRTLSKARHTYRTFLAAEGVAYLKNYLEARLRSGEKLGSESAIISPERAKKEFIRTTNIGDLVRHAFRAAGFGGYRPYVCRTTFATRLLTCENQGKVPHTFAVFWMGHQGEMTSRYSVNRGKLPPELIEEMRSSYRRCEPELSTGARTTDEEKDELYRRSLILVLRTKGATDVDLREMKADSLPVSELEKSVIEKMRAHSEPTHRDVPVGEVHDLLVAGYEYVGPLGTDRAILRAPNGHSPPPAPK